MNTIRTSIFVFAWGADAYLSRAHLAILVKGPVFDSVGPVSTISYRIAWHQCKAHLYHSPDSSGVKVFSYQNSTALFGERHIVNPVDTNVRRDYSHLIVLKREKLFAQPIVVLGLPLFGQECLNRYCALEE